MNHLHFQDILPTLSRTSTSTSSSSVSINNSQTPSLEQYCIGTPRSIASSSNLSLSLSLQEDVIFLSYPSTSSFSYHDQDQGLNPAATTRAAATAETGSDVQQSDFPDISPGIANSISGDSYKGNQTVSPGLALYTSCLGQNSTPTDAPPSILHGSLLLKLTKPTKLKTISVRIYGKYKSSYMESNANPTDWEHLPAGTGPSFQDDLVVGAHTWHFYPDANEHGSSIVTVNSESIVTSDLYGADVAYLESEQHASLMANTNAAFGQVRFKTPINQNTTNGSETLRPDASNLSHNNIPFLSPAYFEKNQYNNKNHTFTANAEDYTLYPAGEYVFHFNLAIDARMPETISCPKSALKYYVVAKVERQSKFAFDASGHREITVVRSPPSVGEMSANEPLAISRDWDNKLHYDILCPWKYLTLGTSVPIRIKLTPIEKVRVHRVRVEIQENITYLSANFASLKHTDEPRKVLLFEKEAKGSVDSNNNQKQDQQQQKLSQEASTQEHQNQHQHQHQNLSHNKMTVADQKAAKRQSRMAMMTGNLLHFNKDATSSSAPLNDTTELDVNIPFVTPDSDWNSLASHHFTNPTSDSKYFQFLRADAIFNPMVHIKHRLHISFRISKRDDQTDNWRYFEVLVDTPIHFLSRHCRTESVDLPSYNSSVPATNISSNSSPHRTSTSDSGSFFSMNSNVMVPTPIRSRNSNTVGIGSPVVRSISSPFSLASGGSNSGLDLDEIMEELRLEEHPAPPFSEFHSGPDGRNREVGSLWNMTGEGYETPPPYYEEQVLPKKVATATQMMQERARNNKSESEDEGDVGNMRLDTESEMNISTPNTEFPFVGGHDLQGSPL